MANIPTKQLTGPKSRVAHGEHVLVEHAFQVTKVGMVRPFTQATGTVRKQVGRAGLVECFFVPGISAHGMWLVRERIWELYQSPVTTTTTMVKQELLDETIPETPPKGTTATTVVPKIEIDDNPRTPVPPPVEPFSPPLQHDEDEPAVASDYDDEGVDVSVLAAIPVVVVPSIGNQLTMMATMMNMEDMDVEMEMEVDVPIKVQPISGTSASTITASDFRDGYSQYDEPASCASQPCWHDVADFAMDVFDDIIQLPQ
jgi:hypothetical protein